MTGRKCAWDDCATTVTHPDQLCAVHLPQWLDPKREPVEHYMRGGIECIDAMRAVTTPGDFQAFCRLTAFKYLWRFGEKDDPVRESKKVLDYARWLHDSLAEVDANADELRKAGERMLNGYKGGRK